MKPKRYWRRDLFTPNGESGVYFLFDKKEIVYIGQSLELGRRFFGHSKKRWDRYRVIKSNSRHQMIKWETILLNRFKPKYNKRIPKLIKPDWYIERQEFIQWMREQDKAA